MKLVPVGKFFAIVDDEDFEKVSNFPLKWGIQSGRRGTKYAWNRHSGVTMHRLILNAPRSYRVDHKNGDGLDNRRENLRLATPSQNQFNKRRPVTNTSGFKGVSWSKNAKKWEVYITAHGERTYLGLFDKIEEAVLARTRAAHHIHGEFARP